MGARGLRYEKATGKEGRRKSQLRREREREKTQGHSLSSKQDPPVCPGKQMRVITVLQLRKINQKV